MQVCNIANRNNRFLDLVFTTDTETVTVEITDPIIKHEPYHFAMILSYHDILPTAKPPQTVKTSLNLTSMDVNAVKRALSNVLWAELFITKEQFDNNATHFRILGVQSLNFLETPKHFRLQH